MTKAPTSKIKMVIVHYHPLEHYPPVINLLRSLAGNELLDVHVCSIGGNGKQRPFTTDGITVKRFGRVTKNRSARYYSYVRFNMATLFYLLKVKPDIIMYYETLSAFSVFCYSRLFPGVKVIIHYHEYVSSEEYANSSSYIRYLHSCEKKLYEKALWVSQTNEQRMQLFMKDNAGVHFNKTALLPNYPPISFYNTGQNTEMNGPVKFVYCGVLGMDNMYLKEFVAYIDKQNGNVCCDFYVVNCSEEVRDYFATASSKSIALKSEVAYDELPAVLKNYHIGIVLHKGSILNYIYNIPNKVLEYLAAGLEVWCSDELTSTVLFKQQYNINRLRIVNFADLPEITIGIQEKIPSNFREMFNAEKVYENLLNFIIKTKERPDSAGA